MNKNRGIARNAMVVMLASLVIVGGLGWTLLYKPARAQPDRLILHCAAGMRLPVIDAAKKYSEEMGIDLEIQYGSTGVLLTQLQQIDEGDLYLAADESFIELARGLDLIDETIPLVQIRPVIAVYKGNPKNIRSVGDLLRDDVKVAIANPGASVGKLTKKLLLQSGQWDTFEAKKPVTTGTVNDAALNVKIKAVDAAVIWDANARQMPELELIHVPLFDKAVQRVTIAVLKTSDHPADALQFARYLQAPEKGQQHFEANGYELIKGDAWSETPKLRLFTGGLNRIAVEKTIDEFKLREGIDIEYTHHGCGILVTMMKAGSIPDVYFACDNSYMQMVDDIFESPRDISETDMVIITKKGNPKNILSLEDLARPELKIGAAHIQKSALGKLTKDLLTQLDLYERVNPQIIVHPPTADILVADLRAGPLDAAIVYRANVARPEVKADIEIIDIKQGRPLAVQPIAISKDSKYKHLAGRLIKAITSNRSRRRFETSEFRWRYDPEQL